LEYHTIIEIMDVINFTKNNLPYGWLGNMSQYPIDFGGVIWKTTEALFQGLRFRIMTLKS
jgi:predicted NAD-dependent protein-ADP-ribosyltransferase YbiA (DUF1768 family)